jgi:hypothetical protein
MMTTISLNEIYEDTNRNIVDIYGRNYFNENGSPMDRLDLLESLDCPEVGKKREPIESQ